MYKTGDRVKIINNETISLKIPVGTLGTVHKRLEGMIKPSIFIIIADGFGFGQAMTGSELEPYVDCEMCKEEIDLKEPNIETDHGGRVCQECYDLHEYCTCVCCGKVAPKSEGAFDDEEDYFCKPCIDDIQEGAY